MRRQLKQITTLLLTGAILFSTLPVNALVVENSDTGGLCEHHPEHTADCGYTDIQDSGDVKPFTIRDVTWESDYFHSEKVEQYSCVQTAKLPKGDELIDGVNSPKISVSAMVNTLTADSRPILYKKGMYYIENPDEAGQLITLFSMNSMLHWPHATDYLGDIEIPNYIEGYLTEKDFRSPQEHAEFLGKASKLLYAGYPHNGAQLYEITSGGNLHMPTAEEFNDKLVPPPQLAADFPILKHYKFTYPATEETLVILFDFIQQVDKLYPGGTTSSGLSSDTIRRLPFYQAAYALVSNPEEALAAFAQFFVASYFVTEQQAYYATQLAFLKLMKDYGIADNDVQDYNGNLLAENLSDFAEYAEILTHQPDMNELRLEGDLTFAYNPKDGLWHSGPLKLVEPVGYNGIYILNLPDGVTTSDNLPYVYGNEEYELVSNRQVGEKEIFTIEGNFTWLKDFRQYSPSPDIEVHGKKFMHMAGAVIEHTTVVAQMWYDTPDNSGTDTPDNPGTDTPDNSGTDTPDNSGTDTPDNSGTDTPDNLGTDTPDNSGTDTPDNPGTDMPDNSGTDTPDNPGTDTPDNSGTDTPDNPSTDTSNPIDSANPDPNVRDIDSIPQTGDDTQLSLWLMLLWISCIGLSVTLAVSRQKYHCKEKK
nr:hypothetical protein [uncultured Lachnoclostridium sp.]